MKGGEGKMAVYLEVTGTDKTLKDIEKIKSLLSEAENLLYHLRPVIGVTVKAEGDKEDVVAVSNNQ